MSVRAAFTMLGFTRRIGSMVVRVVVIVGMIVAVPEQDLKPTVFMMAVERVAMFDFHRRRADSINQKDRHHQEGDEFFSET